MAEVYHRYFRILQLEEITLNYGDDPDNPKPYVVKNKDGEELFTADPNVNAIVRIVDDYADGDHDDKKFFDKFYLKLNKDRGVWEIGQNSKFGMLVKAHPKYGFDHFQKPKPVEEKDFEGFRFEAATEQREDLHGKKLDGTRVDWKTIGSVPDRTKKKKVQKELDEEAEAQLSEAEAAEMKKALG
jgi:hypothetical protein